MLGTLRKNESQNAIDGGVTEPSSLSGPVQTQQGFGKTGLLCFREGLRIIGYRYNSGDWFAVHDHFLVSLLA